MAKRTNFLASAEDYFPNNVVYLDKFRRSRWLVQSVDILYIAEDLIPESTLLVLRNSAHEVKFVCDEEALLKNLGNFVPAIILIESGLKWADPVQLVQSLALITNAPLVMVCTRDTRKADRPQLLKKAFAAGLQDSLPLPLCKDEVEETFGVLLKYRSVVAPSRR